jgi:hypothetical protein
MTAKPSENKDEKGRNRGAKIALAVAGGVAATALIGTAVYYGTRNTKTIRQLELERDSANEDLRQMREQGRAADRQAIGEAIARAAVAEQALQEAQGHLQSERERIARGTEDLEGLRRELMLVQGRREQTEVAKRALQTELAETKRQLEENARQLEETERQGAAAGQANAQQAARVTALQRERARLVGDLEGLGRELMLANGREAGLMRRGAEIEAEVRRLRDGIRGMEQQVAVMRTDNAQQAAQMALVGDRLREAHQRYAQQRVVMQNSLLSEENMNRLGQSDLVYARRDVELANAQNGSSPPRPLALDYHEAPHRNQRQRVTRRRLDDGVTPVRGIVEEPDDENAVRQAAPAWLAAYQGVQDWDAIFEHLVNTAYGVVLPEMPDQMHEGVMGQALLTNGSARERLENIIRVSTHTGAGNIRRKPCIARVEPGAGTMSNVVWVCHGMGSRPVLFSTENPLAAQAWADRFNALVRHRHRPNAN